MLVQDGTYQYININPCFRTSVVQIFTMSGGRVLDNLAGINGGFAWLAPIAILYIIIWELRATRGEKNVTFLTIINVLLVSN